MKMINVKTVGGWIAGSAALIMLGSSVAQADESHWVAGSVCEATNGGYASQVVGGFGAVANKSTSGALQVSCPMFPDHFNYSFIDVTVSVTKNTPAAMNCAEVSRDFGNTSGVVTSQSVSGSGIKSFNFTGIDTQNWLFHTVRCDIPKAGSSSSGSRTLVNGYNYIEHN